MIPCHCGAALSAEPPLQAFCTVSLLRSPSTTAASPVIPCHCGAALSAEPPLQAFCTVSLLRSPSTMAAFPVIPCHCSMPLSLFLVRQGEAPAHLCLRGIEILHKPFRRLFLLFLSQMPVTFPPIPIYDIRVNYPAAPYQRQPPPCTNACSSARKPPPPHWTSTVL